MKKWKACCTGLVLMAGLGPKAMAQGVGVPAGPVAAPVVAGPAVVGAAPAPAPANLWTFLCPPPEKMAACKAYFCASPLGTMFNNGMAPLSALSGGLLPSCCPPYLAADLLKPSDSPEGAAAQIKKDEAEAKARRAAVRYLGTVDCHYWPEAQEALVNALRADRNECVRLEAAWALGRGCCCTRFIIKELAICVEGSDADGNPSETSDRVRAAAQGALAHCLACFMEVKEAAPAASKGEKGREGGERTGSNKGQPAAPDKMPAVPAKTLSKAEAFRHRIETMSHEEVLADGRKALEQMPAVRMAAVTTTTGGHSVMDVVKNAMGGPSLPTQVNSSMVVEQPDAVVEKPVAAPPVAKAVHTQAPVVAAPANTATVVVVQQQPPQRRESLVDAIRNMRHSSPATTIVPVSTPKQAPEPTVVPVVAPEMKPPAKEVKAPVKEVKAPDKEVKAPVKEIKTQAKVDKPKPAPKETVASVAYRESSAPAPVVVSLSEPEVKQPAKEIKPQVKAVPPMVDTKATVKETKTPVVETKPVVKETKAAVVEAKPVVKEVKAPAKESRPLIKKDKPKTAPVESATPVPYKETPSVTAHAVSTYVAATPSYPMPTPVQQAVALSQTARPAGNTAQALTVLRDSAYPDQREQAADSLAGCDGWTNPQVVQTLVHAAKNDEAPLVRAACLRTLARMDVRTMPVLAVVQAGKGDADPRVRYEAEQALTKLGGDAGYSARPR
jgi:hypothetical protein